MFQSCWGWDLASRKFSELYYNMGRPKVTCIIISPKNMLNLPQIILLCLLIAAGIAQSCAAAPDSSLLLQAGAIQVVNPYVSGPPSSIRLHTYSLPIAYAVPPSGFQVATSLGSYQVGSQFGNVWDFTVRGGPGSSPSTAQIALFISEDGGWTKLQVNYLISSRSDLFLGSFIADGFIFDSAASNQLTLNYYVPNWQPTPNEVIAVTEFSGIRTYLAQPLALAFVSTTAEAQTGLLKVVLSTNEAFEELYLTYYWWVVGAPDLAFSTFTLASDNSLAYPFVGIEGVSGSQVAYAGSGFNRNGVLDCNGNGCTQPCVTPGQCQSIGGVVSGPTCTACPANSGWNGNLCVCNPGYNQANGACIACPALSTWVSSQKSCLCLSGYYLINGACTACPPNSGWNGNACVCLTGYYLINSVCSQCPSNTIWNGSGCVCQSGSYLVSGNCVQPPPNTVFNGSEFVCKPGFNLISGVCSQCPPKSSWNGIACVCNSKLYLIGGVCQACPANTAWNGQTCAPICPSKSSWNGSACACLAGYYQIQGSCLPCDPNSAYDGQTCNCNRGFFGNYQLCTPCHSSCSTCSQAGLNGCSSCPTTATLLQGACLAACGAGKVRQGSACVNCPTSCTTCSDATTCTVCAQGFTLTQQIVNQSSVVGCTVPGPAAAGSKLALTGTVVGNSVIYQGVTLSTLPAYFLSTNCGNCGDLFTVLIIPNNLGITYSIDYVLYSQYWFVVRFDYAATGITPSFQFKIQINFKHANYFTAADMAQALFSSIDSSTYPSPAPALAPNPAPFLTPKTTNLVPASAPPKMDVFTASGSAGSYGDAKPSETTRPVVSNGSSSSISAATLITLFS